MHPAAWLESARETKMNDDDDDDDDERMNFDVA